MRMVSVALVYLVLLVAASLLLSALGRAAPPPGSDPNSAIAPWFKSLLTPDGRMSCCGIADCRNFPVRITARGYSISYEGEWIDVPDEVVDRKRFDNPTGDYVACVAPGRSPVAVLCFFLAAGT